VATWRLRNGYAPGQDGARLVTTTRPTSRMANPQQTVPDRPQSFRLTTAGLRAGIAPLRRREQIRQDAQDKLLPLRHAGASSKTTASCACTPLTRLLQGSQIVRTLPLCVRQWRELGGAFIELVLGRPGEYSGRSLGWRGENGRIQSTVRPLPCTLDCQALTHRRSC